MISIRGNLCYSPLPPEDYGDGMMGHGSMYGNDIQLWNLMFLSIPEVDVYPHSKEHARVLYNEIGSGPTAACIALLRGEHMIEMYPNMREWLTLPPMMFVKNIKAMTHGKFKTLPTVMTIPHWLDIITMRAQQVYANDPAQKALNSLIRSSV
jgi:hypothetical protein